MMINIGGFESTWKTIPCSFRFARIWICKHELQRSLYPSTPINFLLTCCKLCIMISQRCYKICHVKVARETLYPRPRQRSQHYYITKISNALSTLQPDSSFLVVISNCLHNVTETFGNVCNFDMPPTLSVYNVGTNTSTEKLHPRSVRFRDIKYMYRHSSSLCKWIMCFTHAVVHF